MATPIPINQCEFTLAEVVEATGGTLFLRDAAIAGNIVGVSIDTRSLKAGALFVALHGAASDGHDYLAQAAALGARPRSSRPDAVTLPSIASRLTIPSMRSDGSRAAISRARAPLAPSR